MNRRHPLAKWSLPLVVHPTKTRCFTIEVPNEPYYIAAFRGALLALSSAYKWQDDTAHTAKEVAAVWMEIIDKVLPCVDCVEPVTGQEWEDELAICESLRISNGKLQGFCCGEWTDIPGQDGITIGGPGQSGGGSPQPEPGGCQTYHAQFAATGAYLVPTVVNAGDVIEFTNADGSGADGALLGSWYCPDGGTFFAGGCLPVYSTDGADPAPAISHMALIAEINAVFYPAFSGSITVPSGIANEQIIIRVNDSTITDNSGSYSLDVEVCNTALPTWYHVLDFRTAPHGAAPTGANGEWIPGTGVSGELDGTGNMVCRWDIPLPTNTHITAVAPEYTNGDLKDNSNDMVRTYSVDPPSGTVIAHYNGTTGDHGNVTNKTDYITGDSPNTRSIRLAMDHYGVTGTDLFTQITIYGTGDEPVWP